MSASCAAGIIYLLETKTGTSSVSESCVTSEQYFDLMSPLIWVAGIVILQWFADVITSFSGVTFVLLCFALTADYAN